MTYFLWVAKLSDGAIQHVEVIEEVDDCESEPTSVEDQVHMCPYADLAAFRPHHELQSTPVYPPPQARPPLPVNSQIPL